MKKLLIATLATTVATLAVAHAEAPKPQDGERAGGFRSELRELIRGDGLDQAALQDLLQKRAEARFNAVDANKDGIISREEALAAADTRAEARFARMDRNEDGVVKRADREGFGPGHHRGGPGKGPDGEHRGGRPDMTPEQRAERREARSAEQFARLDADEDGMISQAEWNAGREARAERWEQRRERHAERRAQRQEYREEARARMPEEVREVHGKLRELTREGMTLDAYKGVMRDLATARFDALDTAGKGELTLADYTAQLPEHAEKMFARMDRNEDGKVTREDHPHRGGMKHETPKPQPKD